MWIKIDWLNVSNKENGFLAKAYGKIRILSLGEVNSR
jgi:hypothetical protein